MSDRVLGLDIATTTGYAVDQTGSPVPLLGHFECGHDSDGYFGKSFTIFQRLLIELIQRHAPAVLAYEAPLEQKRGAAALNSLTTNAKLLGLIAVAQMTAFRMQLVVMPCNVMKIRRHFLGGEVVHKGEVFDRCKMLGWNPASYDESDAAAVWSYAHGELKKQRLLAKRKA